MSLYDRGVVVFLKLVRWFHAGVVKHAFWIHPLCFGDFGWFMGSAVVDLFIWFSGGNGSNMVQWGKWEQYVIFSSSLKGLWTISNGSSLTNDIILLLVAADTSHSMCANKWSWLWSVISKVQFFLHKWLSSFLVSSFFLSIQLSLGHRLFPLNLACSAL